CAIAAEKSGDVWVVYSANRKGDHDLYGRKLDLNATEAVPHPTPNIGPEQRLTKNSTSDLSPTLCTLSGGSLLLAYQHWDSTSTSHSISIMGREKGKWS